MAPKGPKTIFTPSSEASTASTSSPSSSFSIGERIFGPVRARVLVYGPRLFSLRNRATPPFRSDLLRSRQGIYRPFSERIIILDPVNIHPPEPACEASIPFASTPRRMGGPTSSLSSSLGGDIRTSSHHRFPSFSPPYRNGHSSSTSYHSFFVLLDPFRATPSSQSSPLLLHHLTRAPRRLNHHKPSTKWHKPNHSALLRCPARPWSSFLS
ncbi:hypothetical protein C8R46DRAFT_1093551 [Mycena filopes]|nr:hypothetical protein C8R46DRAFT_1093551 [Mycena filopes]